MIAYAQAGAAGVIARREASGSPDSLGIAMGGPAAQAQTPCDPLVLPVSAVVPTRDRADALGRTLASLRRQNVLPRELIVVDASDGDATRRLVEAVAAGWGPDGCRILWRRASAPGAARQRNEGVALATEPVVWFFDDDILFEPDCVRRLWDALQDDAGLGGVNAMIVNQRYLPPGRASRLMFRLMAGRAQASYAGCVLGPAINLLPEDRDDLPDVVPVEWLNTTCTIYRGEALPSPPFPDRFTGYSLMEDLALSLTVAKRWKLANARRARIVHDSQPGPHKTDLAVVEEMQLVNRSYVMTEVMGRRAVADWAKLAFWQLFQLSACAARVGFGPPFRRMLVGTAAGARAIAARHRGKAAAPARRR